MESFIYGGAHFYELEMQLAAILTGKVLNENVTIHKPVTFVDHIKYRSLKRPFYPTKVSSYIKKKSNLNNKTAERVYELYKIFPKTKINSLDGTERKLLSLYSVLSHTKNIVLDFVGQGPPGAEKIFEVLKENAENGGSVIILDNFPDIKEKITKSITVEILEPKLNE